jgi:anti-anti-sigma factor
VRFPEEIDMTNADDLGRTLLDLFADGAATVIVDMSHTTFCASSGFTALLRAHAHGPDDGGLAIAAPTRQFARTAALIGVDQVIQHYATVDDAVAAHGPQLSRTDP